MTKRLLLTSFTTWKPDQPSNASDDLLLELMKSGMPESWSYLRQIPVDFALAPAKVIAHVEDLRPDVVVCCGMAEKRSLLSLEAQAVREDCVLTTALDLEHLSAELPTTEISYDAGRFVCNHLYFELLAYLKNQPAKGLFIHIPILTAENLSAVLSDFQIVLERLSHV